MKIADLTRTYKTNSGLIAIIEAEFEKPGFVEVVGWLDEFYMSKGKELHAKEYWQSHWSDNKREGKRIKRWAHEVHQNGELIGMVTMEYYGQEDKVEEERTIKLQTFGLYFNYPGARQNKSDADSFYDYFHQHIFRARGYTLPSQN